MKKKKIIFPISLQVNQPSAAKQLMDFDKKPIDKKPEFGIGTEFGLKLDQYSKKTGALKNKSAASQAREWTEQETLLLLEALEVSLCLWEREKTFAYYMCIFLKLSTTDIMNEIC